MEKNIHLAASVCGVLAFAGLFAFAWVPFFAVQSHGTWQQKSTIIRTLTSVFYYPPQFVSARLLTPIQYANHSTTISFVWSAFVTVLGGAVVFTAIRKTRA
jgi:hypothetical protein